MNPHILVKKSIINKSIKEVFGFFSKAENLNKLTPSAMGFEIISQLPIKMGTGTIIDYKIKLTVFKMNWRSVITKWDPPFCFEDTQIKGPYKIWIHEHKFEDKKGSTLMTDTIKYLSPGGIFEFIPHYIFVRSKVESIFDYREKILLEMFP